MRAHPSASTLALDPERIRRLRQRAAEFVAAGDHESATSFRMQADAVEGRWALERERARQSISV